MSFSIFLAALQRQFSSRLRVASYVIGAVLPAALIGALLYGAARATRNPAVMLFLAILSALWIGGSSSVREIVDERKLVEREPHLSLLAYGGAKIVFAATLAVGQSLILTASLALSSVVTLPFLRLWGIAFLITLIGSLMALVLSALCNEPAAALAWYPLLLVPQVVFGGFLFPYGPTTPFAYTRSGSVVTMPEELSRQPVRQPVIRLAGSLCIARWALETLAAQTLEQDLSQRGKLSEAIRVANFIPLTLVEESPSATLYLYVDGLLKGRFRAPPAIDARGVDYLALLVAFATVHGLALVLILPLRDPRRASPNH